MDNRYQAKLPTLTLPWASQTSASTSSSSRTCNPQARKPNADLLSLSFGQAGNFASRQINSEILTREG